MSAKILHIQSKNRTPASLFANLQDFSYELGETIDSKTILENPNISLYCLDHKNKQAIFVETPLDIDIYEPPFLYLAQYEYAQRLIAVPYEEFHQLAQDIQDSIGQIIMIYSVGRCGSTLLSKVFNQVDTVLSLSEPDVFSQIVGFRSPDGSNESGIEELLRSCICLLAKSTVNVKESFCAIKLRSFGIEVADLIHRICPEAKLIFMYRNAEDVVKSSMRAFVYFSKILPIIEQNVELYSQFVPLLKEYANYIDFKDSKAIDFYTIMWLSVIHRYLLLYQAGIPISALRYEDLTEDSKQVVTSIFNYCGLPESEASNACLALQKDSQSGSNFSRENTRENESNIPDILEIQEKINALLDKHPTIKTADFIVPNTLKFC
ncbi:sulfotransferase [Anabaena sp. UHCC 0451]|uniref:sulfotransferase n=1 Tax=Anabaena sp. UHCC 0451 TaxID=2055235 RepID=UPI002B210D90|nr:sulfotransferase [Anabaena sp. UHCC 0451]MEA5578439.1 sulfotransferase [Anabaena sp. UHCC 0451]